jgi:hypothetical protein
MCHGFRKFAITQMAMAGMDYEIRERLVGHTIGMAQRYIRFAEQKYVEEYLKAVDLLTIRDENRLKRKVETLTIRTDELSNLKNQLNEFKEWRGNMINQFNEISERHEQRRREIDKKFEKKNEELEKYRVEWIKKENEVRRRLPGVNLIPEDAYK